MAKCPSEYSGIQGQVFKWFIWPGAAKTQEHQLNSTDSLQIAWEVPTAATLAGLGSQAEASPSDSARPLGVSCVSGAQRRSLLLEEKGKTQNFTVCTVTSGAAGRVKGAPR